MNSCQFLSQRPRQTINLAQQLSPRLQAGDILCLYGDLGSGKTTFVKGLAKGLKIDPRQVHSPTFTLLNIYPGRLTLYHFDFYRLEDLEEITLTGYEEFLYGQGVSVIEWADRMGPLLPKESLKIQFDHQGLEERFIRLSPVGKGYAGLLKHLTVK